MTAPQLSSANNAHHKSFVAGNSVVTRRRDALFAVFCRRRGIRANNDRWVTRCTGAASTNARASPLSILHLSPVFASLPSVHLIVSYSSTYGVTSPHIIARVV